MSDIYLSKRRGCYQTDVISSDGYSVILTKDSSHGGWVGSGCIEVHIPQELFAREPWDWNWVNRWFKTPPRDQCVLRRRRIFAYSLQPPIFLAELLLRGIKGIACWLFSLCAVLSLLSVGARGINWSPLLHPLIYEPSQTWEKLRAPVFIPSVRGRHFPLPLVVSPAILGVAAIFSWINRDAALSSLAWPSAFGIAMLVLLALFTGITLAVQWYERVNWTALEMEREKRRYEKSRERMAAEIEEMVCPATGPRRPDISGMPIFRVKTIRFRVLALKQRICKGFAG